MITTGSYPNMAVKFLTAKISINKFPAPKDTLPLNVCLKMFNIGPISLLPKSK